MKINARFVIYGLVVCLLLQTGLVLAQQRRLNRDRVIITVFLTWFEYNLGIKLNPDRIYEDGKKWVDQVDEHLDQNMRNTNVELSDQTWRTQ